MKIKVGGVSLYYEVHGQGDPILFIHGFPLSGRMWSPLVEPLRSSWRLIIPDLRGHGQSEATPESSMAQYADDLVAVLDAAAPNKPAVIVGLSMGGYIAFEFYRRHRARIRALILADTRAGADTPEGVRGRLQTAEQVMKDGSRVIADAMIGKLFAPTVAPAIRDQWREIMSNTSPVGVAAALHAIAARPDSTPTLAAISVPTLIVVGDHDVITPPVEAEKLHAGIAGSRLEIIAGAGHVPPVETPDGFARCVQTFLRSLKST